MVAKKIEKKMAVAAREIFFDMIYTPYFRKEMNNEYK